MYAALILLSRHLEYVMYYHYPYHDCDVNAKCSVNAYSDPYDHV